MAAEVQWDESSVSSLILLPEVGYNGSMISTTEISETKSYNQNNKIEILSLVVIQIPQPTQQQWKRSRQFLSKRVKDSYI